MEQIMEHYRAYQDLGNEIKKLITSENYSVGQKLMSERDIALHFDVSRSLVREALIMLEIEDLISIKKGSGIYIKHLPNDMPAANINTDYGPFEVLQARQLVESAIASFAALNATKADILEMKAILNDERNSLDSSADGENNDYRFHQIIVRASQNGMMEEIFEKMWTSRFDSPMWDKLHEHIEDKNFRKQWLFDHERILNALQRRDAELARKEMWQHLENVKQTLMQLSDFDDPHFDGYLFESVPYETIFEKN